MSNQSDPPDPARLFGQLNGFEFTQLTYVVCKLRIPDLLKDGPMSAEEIAAKVDAHPQSLFRVMRYLASIGIFTQDESQRFGLNTASSQLTSDNPKSMWPWAILSGEEFYKSAGELLHTVKTGETASTFVYGQAWFDYLSAHPDTKAVFERAMGTRSPNWEKLLGSFDPGEVQTVIDVGGGQGALLGYLLHTHPKLKGVLFEMPPVAKAARQHLESIGLGTRCEAVEGDARQSIPAGGDLYVMCSLLRYYHDEEARTILGNCRRAASHDSTLLMIEGVVPAGPGPAPSKTRDMPMLYVIGGIERTEAEWRDLLTASGFSLSEIRRTGLPFDLLIAKPA